jgi:tRNA(Arg) A34 adenosine deaminase TadA
MTQTTKFLCEAIELAHANLEEGGQPFGAVLVKDGEVLATGVNRIQATNDPTAHAELLAVREACQKVGSPILAGTTMYASGQPCALCLAAMRLAGVNEIFYAYSSADWEPVSLASGASPLAEDPATISHVPARLDAHPDIYAEWKKKQDQVG